MSFAMRQLHDIAHFFASHHLRLATAESCTAGLIAARIADVPGCGSVLQCAIVAYAPSIKTGLLGVAPELIAEHGLTSEPVSRAMARGALALADVTLAIANTGVADGNGDGPTPAGTQCFAWLFRIGDHTHVFSETIRFHGTRNAVRTAAADWALSRAVDLYLTLGMQRA
ncbi:MAG TPA: nicotinamide-nucleotide amidohydrolase family protein [Burkholderiaceae bacterium]|jgi:PncC family amidohydrolase|nr:nicotinamide-nucleotide amidohydrolase family protein [Burkholderiaceae bacterium]